MDVVWFKKDLRTKDHEPLTLASRGRGCLCIYVYEDEILSSPEYDSSHHEFINEGLRELKDNLRAKGNDLHILRGCVPEVFSALHRKCAFTRLLSHEETGNLLTYQRDLRVKQWCRENGVEWIECTQTGVVRRLANRDGWSRQWVQRMTRPVLSSPAALPPAPTELESTHILPAQACGLPVDSKTARMRGGERHAWSVFESFLRERGQYYSMRMSSPVTAHDACSRLSPYLAYGNISMKEVFQITKQRQDDVRADRSAVGWGRSLSAFQARLRWHCHFTQKLEDEPSLEHENMNRGFDGMRDDFDSAKFLAWQNGETGYPLVDACMRCLHATGWINFRMRAMLASFSSYHLWLHWREPSLYLAKHFLDFEPGIHFNQYQMQSGTTGINSVRIYSPVKQVADQDPEGVFIKAYVPELSRVPDEYLAEPHTMPLSLQREVGCEIDTHYPAPIVDHKTAYKEARAKLGEWRRKDEVKVMAKDVYQKHGSRKRPQKRRPTKRSGAESLS